MQRTKYAPEFKDEAVKQVIDKGHSVVDVAKRLGIPDNVLYAWVSKFKKADEPSTNDLKVLQAEMAKLKAELRRTTEERDILKKAALDSTGQCNMIQIMLKGIRNDYIAERLDAGTTPTFVADVEDGEQYYGYWNLFEQGTRLGTHLSFTSRRHCATKPPAC
jgi:transposase